MAETLEQLIRRAVPLGKLSNSGWYSLHCPVCSDYKTRLGLKFEIDSSVIANCFNCGFAAVYDGKTNKLPVKMRKLLSQLSIGDNELDKFETDGFFNIKREPSVITLESLKKLDFSTPEQQLPDGAELLTAATSTLASHVRQYLIKRCISPSEYPFYIAPKQYPFRVIIPFYRRDKLIFWQARAIGNMQPRYLSCSAPKDAVLFNYDALYRDFDKPLFVCEGVFDAHCIDGVSSIGSSLNATKIEIFKNSKRTPVFVIDPDKNGHKLAEKALSNGWKITFAPRGTDDVNDAIQKYGRLYTVFSLMNNQLSNGFEARAKLAVHCSSGKTKR